MTVTDTTKTSFRRRTVLMTALASAIAMIGLAGAPRAQADPVDLQVVDRNTGQVLRLWRHHGRLFVAGRPGARYALRVSNHTEGRVLVVLSVDGVNILSGETAGYGQRGYIFKAYESYDVSGWRKSDTEVAAFTFAPLPESYAARTGRPGDVGVIGMAVFDERVPEPPPEPQATYGARDSTEDADRSSSEPPGLRRSPPPSHPQKAMPAPRGFAPAPQPPSSSSIAPPAQRGGPTAPLAENQGRMVRAAPALRRDEKLGTAHGAREWSAITIMPFERASPYPQFTRQIEYDTYARLAAAGVIPTAPYPPRRPRPFPQSPDGAGYVPDPPPSYPEVDYLREP